MRFVVDGSWQRVGPVVIAGSPLRIFRLTARGASVATDLEDGRDVESSRLVDRLLDGGAIHPRHDLTEQRAARSATYGTSDVTIVTPQFGGAVATDGRVTVDDGSTPPLADATRRIAPNRGPAAARNAGMEFVDTHLVAFVDADVELHDGWLDALLPHFDDQRVGLVAPRVTGERGSPLDLGGAPARIRAGTRVSYVPGAAMVMRVDAFRAVGGFDERLRYGEDVDLVWRLDRASWTCRYEPLATVWHEPRSSWPARLRQHASYGSSAAPLALRHPRSLSPVLTNGWTAGVWALVATGHPFAATSVALGTAGILTRKLADVPPKVSFWLAMRGHLGAVEQLAAAIRRVWWPIVLVGAVSSKRVRWMGLAAVIADVRSTPTDLAYGWGVWLGMCRHRTVAPIVPRLISWPPSTRPPISLRRSP